MALLLADDLRRYVAANDAACQLLGIEHAQLMRMRIDDVVPHSGASEQQVEARWREFLKEGKQRADIVLRAGDRRERTVSFIAQANVLPGLHLSVVIDVSEQRALERRTSAERDRLDAVAQLGRDRATRLQAVTAALARARTLDEVACVIVDEGCTAFDARRGVLALVVEAGAAMEVVRVHGEAAGLTPAEVRPKDRYALTFPTPLTDAIRSLEPQIYETAEVLSARFPALFEKHWSPYGAMLALPLALHTHTPAIGAMALSYAGPRTFGDEEQVHLLAFSRLCAQALERARLFDLATSERKRAEDANRVKDEFLAIVSHELRTPLQSMLGWATLVRSGKLDSAALERALLTIERNAHAQAKLVEDLLDVTRITSGKMRLHVEPTSPFKIIEAALDVMRPAADAKGVRLEARLDSKAVLLAADPDRLQQVVWNLLSNAVKFTDRGGSVHVSLRSHHGHVEIVVEDTGRGIDPEFMPFLYERFRQAETSKRGRLGLGLGLSIVRDLVELHGGTIEAESAGLGLGSRFTVLLPLSP